MAEANISSQERLEFNPLVKTAIKDFYLSFKFSQGNPLLQMKLFDYMARTYPAEMSDVLATFPIPSQLDKLTVPQKHRDIKSTKKEFTEQWKNLQYACKLHTGSSENTAVSYYELTHGLTSHM